MPAWAKVSGTWQRTLPWDKRSGSWEVPLAIRGKVSGALQIPFFKVPASCIVLMKTSGVPVDGTLFNRNGYWAYSATASLDTQGPGSNTKDWATFGSYGFYTNYVTDAKDVYSRTLSANGYASGHTSHRHLHTHSHSGTTSHYPSRVDLRGYTGCRYLPVGAVVFARTPITHTCLTAWSVNYFSVRFVTATTMGSMFAGTVASKAFTINTSTAGGYQSKKSWLRSKYFYSGHYHSTTHTHSLSTTGTSCRYYRAYEVTSPIYDFNSLPVGSMVMAISTVGFPSGWSAYATTGYTCRGRNDANNSANAGSSTTTCQTSTGHWCGSRLGGTSRQCEAGSALNSINPNGHTFGSHAHVGAVSNYPQTWRVAFMEKAA